MSRSDRKAPGGVSGLIPVHRPYLGEAEAQAVQEVLDSRWLGMGNQSKLFEQKLRDFLGARHVLAVNTCTAALQLALESLGVGPGDEVIVPSLTFVSSVQAVMTVGATPVFCEVKPETLTVDVADVRGRVTPRTKVLLPVHYGGQACDMKGILELAGEERLFIVEDAAHAFGSSYQGRKIGTVGDITCFSFDPIKNITCGTGGALATDDDDIAGRVAPSRNVGIDVDSASRLQAERPWFYQVVSTGSRYHLSDINAAIGLKQLERMEEFRKRKLAVVRCYDDALRGLDGISLLDRKWDETFPFSYVVRVLDGQRDSLGQFLRSCGVTTLVQFIPNHMQPAFAASRVPLPVTEQLYEEILTLPLFCEMTEDHVHLVVNSIRSFLEESKVPAMRGGLAP